MKAININFAINNNAIIGLKNIFNESKQTHPRGSSVIGYAISLSNSYQPTPEFNDNRICYEYCNNSGPYYAD